MTARPADPDPITVLDLFAGCGGLTEGFHQFRPDGADRPVFRSVGAVEWDKPAAASYAMNFGATSPRPQYFEPPEIHADTIVGWTPHWQEGEIDVVVGGPPCQGFSGLNRNRVGAERNQLWQEFVRVVVATQPKVFVIENVDRFVRSPEFEDLKHRIGNGELSRYRLVTPPEREDFNAEKDPARRYLLNAANYGAVQARRRAIVIGVRTDPYLDPDDMSYPEGGYSRRPLIDQAMFEGFGNFTGKKPKKKKTPWRTIDGLFNGDTGRSVSGTELPHDRGEKYIEEISASVPGPFSTKELHFTRNPEQLSLARYSAIPPRGNRKDLRGRYLCTLDTGGSMILEKLGPYRNDDGSLRLAGPYAEVVNDRPSGRTFALVGDDATPVVTPGRSGRSTSQAFRVTLREGDDDVAATLEYLSTDSWDAHNAGSGDVMGRLRLGEPSVTIRTEFFKPEKGRYLHPTENRPITHYEAAILQGFPEDFLWCGSKTDIARQIGNAVPIPLGKAIAGAIYEYLRPARERATVDR